MNTRIMAAVVLLATVVLLTGCGDQNAPAESFFKTGKWRFLSPEKNIAKPDQAEVNWIIQSMGELDETEEMYPNATRPKPEDWVYIDEDYVIGPTDIVNINILDLYAEGLETVLQREVSDSGYLDVPQVADRVKAEGLTQQQLVARIKQAYQDAGILREPVVSVTVVARRQQTFSIMGSVIRPGTYNIVRRDMRLLEALALSGGVAGAQNIEYLYVIRQAPAIRKSEIPAGSSAQPKNSPGPAPDQPLRDSQTRRGELDRLLGSTGGTGAMHFAETVGGAPADSAATDPLTPNEDSLSEAITGPSSTPATGQAPAPAETADDTTAGAATAPTLDEAIQNPATTAPSARKTHRWVYRDGQWVREEVTETAPATQPEQAIPAPPSTASQPVQDEAPRAARSLPAMPGLKKQPTSPEDPFGWADMEKEDLVRVIAINLEKLQRGDYRQNIVIRENDVVQVPDIEIGEFYIMGEVLRPGVYSLTGRKITVKQALAAAGNLGPLAWPENSVLIRRIGKNQEQIIPLNVEKIIRGTDPDLYLKPDDVIAVGTAWQSTFLAVLRNAFRMTYGFGFIYDRNFADPLTIYPNSKRFKGL